jgi:hypothetical protein
MTSHFTTPDRSPTVQDNIKHLIDAVPCYQTVRQLRWPTGIACPSCQSTQIIKRGVEVVIVGSLPEEERAALEAHTWESLGEALERMR